MILRCGLVISVCTCPGTPGMHVWWIYTSAVDDARADREGIAAVGDFWKCLWEKMQLIALQLCLSAQRLVLNHKDLQGLPLDQLQLKGGNLQELSPNQLPLIWSWQGAFRMFSSVFFKEGGTCHQSSEGWLITTTICKDCCSVDGRSVNLRVAPPQAVLEASILCTLPACGLEEHRVLNGGVGPGC